MYKSKKIDFVDHLTIAVKILTGLIPFSIILGGFLTNNYLDFIQQPSVFAEVISNPSSLSAILVVLGVFLFLFLIGFATPYSFLSFLSDIEKNNFINRIRKSWLIFILSFPLLIFLCLIIAIILYDYCEKELPNWVITTSMWAMLFSPIITYIIIYIISWIAFKRKTDQKNSCIKSNPLYSCKEFFIYLLPIAFSTLGMAPIQVLSMLSTATWLPEGMTQYLFVIIFCVLLFINICVAIEYLSSYSKNNKNNKIIFATPFVFSILIILLAAMWSNNFALRMLIPIRFVETPQHAAWYLLHNNFQRNNGRQEINGIDKMDLRRLKQNFSCSALLNEQIKTGEEKKSDCSTRPEKRNNALYGYMAWNLGNTKVFCPATVRNDKGDKESKKIADYCVVINANSLQIMNPRYIDIMPKAR